MRKIGIILVNFNGLQDTIECIQSVYKSDYNNYLIIVIDNASKEDASVLNTYSNVLYIKLDSNVGFGVANNIGADKAIECGCELLLCLNNDTVIESDTLTFLERNTTDKTITTGAIYYFSDRKKLWYGGGEVSRFKGNFRHKDYCNTRSVSFVSGCCIMLTSGCYKNIGLFDPAYFMYYEDSDFSLKAILNGYELKYIYEARIYHKVGKSINKTVGLKDYYLTRNRLYILKKYKRYFYLTAIVYFYLTRGLYIVKNFFVKNETWPFFEGIHDFKKNFMGARKE